MEENPENNQDIKNTSVLEEKYSNDLEGDLLKDTIIEPFVDKSYRLKVVYNTKQFNNGVEKNMIVVFSKGRQTLFTDSLRCSSLLIERKDMNNDGFEDILIFNSSGGRANPTYYLFLLNPSAQNIIKIQDFERLPNPDIDGNIITSVALAGMNYIYKFYSIKGNKLVDLNYSFETDMGDTVKYKQTIKMLINKQKFSP